MEKETVRTKAMLAMGAKAPTQKEWCQQLVPQAVRDYDAGGDYNSVDIAFRLPCSWCFYCRLLEALHKSSKSINRGVRIPRQNPL